MVQYVQNATFIQIAPIFLIFCFFCLFVCFLSVRCLFLCCFLLLFCFVSFCSLYKLMFSDFWYLALFQNLSLFSYFQFQNLSLFSYFQCQSKETIQMWNTYETANRRKVTTLDNNTKDVLPMVSMRLLSALFTKQYSFDCLIPMMVKLYDNIGVHVKILAVNCPGNVAQQALRKPWIL